MTDNTPSGGQPSGLLDHLRELSASFLEYLQARLTLAGIEAREAFVHFGIIIAAVVAALGLLLFGYLFLCIALTVLIAALLHVFAGWVILGLALIHFVIALGCIIFVAARIKTSVFAATLAELKKDQQWLRQSQTPRQS